MRLPAIGTVSRLATASAARRATLFGILGAGAILAVSAFGACSSSTGGNGCPAATSGPDAGGTDAGCVPSGPSGGW